MKEDLELLESLIGSHIEAVAEDKYNDAFYLRIGSRILHIYAIPTNVSTGVPIIQELTPSEIRNLRKTLKDALSILGNPKPD